MNNRNTELILSSFLKVPVRITKPTLSFSCEKCGETVLGVTLADLRILTDNRKFPCNCIMSKKDQKQNDNFLKSYNM